MIPSHLRTINDLLRSFPNEQSCVDYLEQMRFKDGVISPFDPESKVYECKPLKRKSKMIDEEFTMRRFRCDNTKKYFNVLTGTIFQSSKVDLQQWFLAIFMCLICKKGKQSVQLFEEIGVSQKTAWYMLQRIRTAFGHDIDHQLSGVVEADESFCGGKNKNRHKDKKVHNTQGRSFKDKTPVLGLMQRQTDFEVKKVKLFVIESTSRNHIQPIIADWVEKGSTFYSDEWTAYRGLDSRYNHQYIDHSKGQYVDGEVHTNTIEGFWGIFKRGLIGTYQRVSKKHLQLYCNEFSFRYNHRHLDNKQKFLTFFDHIDHNITYKDLVA